MKRPGPVLNLRQWPQAAGLAVAGVLAFAAAASLSTAPADEAQDAGGLVLPADRARTSNTAQGADQAATALVFQRVDRLNDNVTHNPFAALNLQAASAAKAASEPVPTAPPPKTSTKPPEVVPPPPPPPPMAPPLPFTAVGSIAGADLGDGRPVAFVRQQDRLLLVRAGDTIGQTYRVESVTANKVEFTYLPLMQRQALPLTP